MKSPVSTLASRCFADTFTGDKPVCDCPTPDYASRFYADTFGEFDYDMDVEENLGFRTPSQDKDLDAANAMFDQIRQSYQ